MFGGSGSIWTIYSNPMYFPCDVCKESPFKYENFRCAIVNELSDYTKYTYITTWEAVSYGVKSKCNWCPLLIRARDSLPDFLYHRHDPSKSVTVGLRIIIADTRNMLEIYLDGFFAAEYYIYSVEGNVAVEELGTGQSFRNSPSYVDYDKAKERLENCNRHHDTCPTMQETTLPTRVIDCTKPSRPLLVETHRKTKGRYATLSYSWGGDQGQKLTEDNIETYLQEGLPTDLPQTITDAITATHKLGLRWLWVDAFCIMQDSDEDKLFELRDMARIYLESYVTLSILTSFRAAHGFLPDEGEHPFLPFHVNKSSVGTMHLKYHIPPRITHGDLDPPEPLRQRAWCFQETILAPRRLVFYPPNIMYSCRGYEEDITRPEEGGQHDGPQRVPVTDLFSDQKKVGVAAKDDKSLRALWDSLLTRYSTRNMTKPSDKLVAFSSVVEVYQGLTKDDYLAGLWRHKLVDDLLWESRFMEERPKEYRAPTWSWASVWGGVTLHEPDDLEARSTDYEATVVSCKVVPKSHLHPLGEVKQGTLRLKVRMHPLMLDGRKCRFIEKKVSPSIIGKRSKTFPGNGRTFQGPKGDKVPQNWKNIILSLWRHRKKVMLNKLVCDVNLG